MEVTYLDQIELDGPLTELVLSWSGTPGGEPTPLTFNQRTHLAAAEATGRSTWIGGMIDVGGPENWSDQQVCDALHAVIASSSALCGVASGGAQCFFSPADLTITPETPPARVEAPPLTVDMDAMISTRCRPGDVPGLFAARIGATVLIAADHFHVDMLSIDMVLRRFKRALHGQPVAEAVGRPTERTTGIRPEPRITPAKPWNPRAEAPNPIGNRDALTIWRRFFATTGGRVPDFPVELSCGATDPVHDVRHLATAEELTGDLDTRTFAVVLTALAEALVEVTGTPEFATVIPVHTRGRRDDPRHGVIGWMVGNAPVIAHAGEIDATLQWLRDAVTVAALPLETMIGNCHPVLPTGVVPMVSYMDFRGRGEPLPRARYISSTSPTDTAQLWFSRTRDGLALRAKYPDTVVARRVMGQVLNAMTVRLHHYSH